MLTLTFDTSAKIEPEYSLDEITHGRKKEKMK
jgi:hypothetical protein